MRFWRLAVLVLYCAGLSAQCRPVTLPVRPIVTPLTTSIIIPCSGKHEIGRAHV